MITTGYGWVLRHQSARFLATHHELDPASYSILWTSWSLVEHSLDATVRYLGRPEAEQFVQYDAPNSWPLDLFEVVPGPACACCGGGHPRHYPYGSIYKVSDGTVRCEKHKLRNPCAVEGCQRTRATPQGWYSNDDYLCGEHWKIACPPRSPMRRAYHRIWRLQKKTGKWTNPLWHRHERLWRGIVARARGRSAGDLDMTEIEKMFGWAA